MMYQFIIIRFRVFFSDTHLMMQKSVLLYLINVYNLTMI